MGRLCFFALTLRMQFSNNNSIFKQNKIEKKAVDIFKSEYIM